MAQAVKEIEAQPIMPRGFGLRNGCDDFPGLL
jgi:hypothetical protein